MNEDRIQQENEVVIEIEIEELETKLAPGSCASFLD
jgi:hypothetical protein